MSKLLMMIGLPASGKSTLAYELVQGGSWIDVNKDTIRKNLRAEGWVWSREAEKDVIARRDAAIVEALRGGLNVVSSDTNFGRKHKVRLEQLARENGAEFEIKRFDVPLQVCLERNKGRVGDELVPEKTIHEMYRNYVMNDPAHFPVSGKKAEVKVMPYKFTPGLPNAIICDLDGTISLFKEKGHRGPYNAMKCDEDDVNEVVLGIISMYDHQGIDVIFLSGREDQWREPTLRFLAQKCMFDAPNLFMRATGDHRKDSIVRAELFDQHVRGKYNVEFVLDDRDQVVKMWRDMGLTCLQVAEGAF